ncbi:MAG: hypothetical protein OXO51_17030 [Gemmatimonadota bacterium]|nr:hypothetical protein [Gemmatimonadota bacterium]
MARNTILKHIGRFARPVLRSLGKAAVMELQREGARQVSRKIRSTLRKHVEHKHAEQPDAVEARSAPAQPNGFQQHLLYIWANADQITADVISWNYFGPFDAEYQFDPRHECPYRNIKEALADGWRIISFPKVEYPLENSHNQLGHEFILERFFPPGGGLPHTPHGARKQDTAHKHHPREGAEDGR